MDRNPGLLRKVKAILAEFPLRPGATFIVAVSGGPDSVALLRAMAHLNKSSQRVGESASRRVSKTAKLANSRTPELPSSLIIAHFHHGIRGREADRDERFVRALGKSLGIPVRVARADVPALARRKGLSLETAAREARHAFFASLARRRGAAGVMIGHTADDQAETILLRILRGTGIEGLSGMAPVSPSPADPRVPLVRPLLEATRTDVLDYLRTLRQPFRTDRTNQSGRFARNRVRHDILPVLATLNPRVRESLIRLGEVAGPITDYIRDDARRFVDIRRGQAVISRRRWKKLHPALRLEVLREGCRRAAPNLPPAGRDWMTAAEEFILSPVRRGDFPCGGGIRIRKRAGYIIIANAYPAFRDTSARAL
ncbi:MAG: tRNA lysidine(34) synthetase TilS [Planctomycetota bacterium]